MSHLSTRLQLSGVRLTAQRRVVADVLDGENVHMSADEVLDRAQVLLPEIGRATVYKALSEFVRAGQVREVQSGDGSKRFDPNAHIEHHHLRCRVCGSLWDQPASGLSITILDEISPAGFGVESIEVTMLGLCDPCHSSGDRHTTQ